MEAKAPITVLFLGDASVGKTSIIHTKFHENIDPVPTINTASFTTNVNGVSLLLYDTAGQERFHSTTTFFYRQASIAVIVFDVSNIQSFENLDYWINSLHDYIGNLKIILVGNKVDVGQSFEKERIKEFADRLNCEYVFTSALTGDGIDELFNTIAETSSNINIPVSTDDSIGIVCDSKKKPTCC